MKYLADKMGQVAQVVDAQSKILNNLNPNASITPQKSKLEEYAGLVEKFSPIIDKIFPKDNAPALIDNETIQNKMKQTFFDNLETGESINTFIKNALKKSVTKQVINTSLADIGKSNEAIEHRPA